MENFDEKKNKPRKKHKYINGTKGVISILLALIMVPFASMADLLVEAARYRNSQEVLQELMDSSSYSVLSNYDKYLLKRFGLLAIDQSKNMNNLFSSYLLKNIDSLTTWDIDENDITVTGLHPLSENKALMNQILEISKYSIPTSLAGTLISELLDCLDNMTKVTSFFNLVGSVGDTTNSALTMCKDLEELKSMSDGVATAVSAYDDNFSSFQTAVANLAAKIGDMQSKKAIYDDELEKVSKSNSDISDINDKITKIDEELEQLEKDYKDGKIDKNKYEADQKTLNKTKSDKNDELKQKTDKLKDENKSLKQAETNYINAKNTVNSYITSAQSAKSAYSSAIGDLESKLSTYNEKANTIIQDSINLVSSTASLANSATSYEQENDEEREKLKDEKEKLKKQKDATTDEDKKNQIQSRIDTVDYKLSAIDKDYKNAKNAYKSTSNELGNVGSKLDEAMKEHDGSAIANCITSLGNLKTKVNNYNIEDVKTSTRINKSDYYVNIPSYATSDAIDSAMNEAAEQLKSDGAWTIINGLLSIFKTLFKTNLVFDANLNAYIAQDAGYSPSDLDLVLGSLSDMITSVSSFAAGVKSFNVIQMLKAAYDTCVAVVSFITNFINYIKGVASRAVESVKQLFSDKCGDKLLLDEYLLKSVSNRTNMNSYGEMGGKDILTKYSYSKVEFDKADGVNNIPVIGDLAAIVQLFKDIATGGSNQMFCGAELEYILIGSRSEIVNQSAVFMQLYLIRAFLNIPNILGDAEVEAIAGAAAAAAGIGEIVVYLIYAFSEPLIDTILLVNDGEIPIIKSYVFLTPSGSIELFKNIGNLGLSKADQDNIENTFNEKIKDKTKGKYTPVDPENEVKKDFGKMDYERYLFIMMLLFGENNEYLNRFQNLVNMESKAYYKKVEKPFDIKNTYTYLDATVSGKFVPILPLGDIVFNNLFDSTQHEIRGY